MNSSESRRRPVMAWFRNVYRCDECGVVWEDEWSCMCDDECPACGSSDYSPEDSEDLSVIIEKRLSGNSVISYSPGTASNRPDYVELAEVSNPELLKLLIEVGYELSREPIESFEE